MHRGSSTLTQLLPVLALLCACGWRTTSVGTRDDTLVRGDAGEPGEALEQAPPLGPGVICASDYRNHSGLLLDPPTTCVQSLSRCSDGHQYQLICDGLSCDCILDGWPEGHIYSPACVSIERAAPRCGWSLSTTSWSEPVPGEPCDAGQEPAAPCSCVDGHVECADADGCTLSGAYATADGASLLRFATDGTFFATSSESASFEGVSQGSDPGYYGTYQRESGELFVRSVHSPTDPSCIDVVGHYQVAFGDACNELTLRAANDGCAARAPLTAAPWLRE